MSTNNVNAQSAPKKRSLGFIVILLVTLISCTTAGYCWYQLQEIKTSLQDGKGNEKGMAKSTPAEPIYFPLETFTVSLKPVDDDEDRVLYIGITLRLKNNESRMLMERFLPEIRSRLLRVFSQQNAKELSGDEGKSQLVERIKAEVNKPLYPDQKVEVTDVLFNAFILR